MNGILPQRVTGHGWPGRESSFAWCRATDGVAEISDA